MNLWKPKEEGGFIAATNLSQLKKSENHYIKN